jgi:hypothetical protein
VVAAHIEQPSLSAGILEPHMQPAFLAQLLTLQRLVAPAPVDRAGEAFLAVHDAAAAATTDVEGELR